VMILWWDGALGMVPVVGYINADIKDINKVLKNVRASLYTYIFISPELASILSF
jgi:phage-related tail protein